MPSPNLNAKIIINSSSPNDLTNTSWDVSFSVTDLEGNFNGNNIQINDILFLDTSTEYPGTITRFKIQSISSQNFTDVSCAIIFDDNNTNKPDLGYVIGIDGIVLRPSQFDYNLIPDPSSQLVSNKFAIFPLNNNWKNISQFIRNSGSYSQNKSLISEIDEKISSSQIDNLVHATQQEYESIAQKNSRTIYIIESPAS
jgi:hypothetical protein